MTAKAFLISIIFCFCISFEAVAENSPKMVPESFSSIAEKVGPAVVNIRTVKTIKGGGPVFKNFFNGPKNHPMDDLFKEFFD